MEDNKIIKKGLIYNCIHEWKYENNTEVIIVNDSFKFVYTRKCDKCKQVERVILDEFIL
ncbi:hypothetical protein [Clostridium botulinum]|uniref:hypothetical protein n=1 Tax=Clostridium botulinum TaxID=1491 RepID=UPI000207566B|nr:hypothetical protein [Clostridium botulinum]AEB77320.1 hypothetical protein CbC4_4120 [Clostridium botulinum BKT015925]KEH96521.1 hypothetical protein Z953_p0100 [Clostridium botulinum D str. 16868]KLU74413.1 hypothetical protein CBC3_p0117 [Clostridium botulinum V891]MCD3196350.1 hypothetical protein [Clostridium botulinum C/D]MCD3202339.1 hypothetical protein [Clostridium botulinum C/D]